jgi:hypothetical protein
MLRYPRDAEPRNEPNTMKQRKPIRLSGSRRPPRSRTAPPTEAKIALGDRLFKA